MGYPDLTANQKEGMRWKARLGQFNQGRPIVDPVTGKPDGALFAQALMVRFGDEGYLDKQTYIEDARRKKIGIDPSLATPIDNKPDPPLVFSCIPATGAKAGGGTITVHGEGFAAGMVVRVGGAAATNVVITNQTTATFTLPAHAIAEPVRVEVETALGPAGLDAAFSYV